LPKTLRSAAGVSALEDLIRRKDADAGVASEVACIECQDLPDAVDLHDGRQAGIMAGLSPYLYGRDDTRPLSIPGGCML
jgi:hypothetical protein